MTTPSTISPLSGFDSSGQALPGSRGVGAPIAAADLLTLVLEEPGTTLVLLNATGQVGWFSPAATAFFISHHGNPLQVGQSFSSLVLPAQASALNGTLQQALAGTIQEINLDFADGTTWQVFLRSIEKDGFKGALLSFRQQAATSPLLHPLKWQVAVQRVHLQQSACVLVDRNFRIQSFNAEAARSAVILLNKEVVAGKHMFEYALEPGNSELLEAVLQRVFAGKIQHRHISCTLPGPEVQVLAHYLPVYDQDGSVSGCMILLDKLSEPGSTTTFLYDDTPRWRFALEGNQQGLWDWNMAQNKVCYSDAWYRMMGYAPGIIGTTMEDYEALMHPEDIAQMRRHRQLHAHSPAQAYESEFRLRHGNGQYLWIHARGMIIYRDEGGRPLRMIGTHTDITSRKLAEEKYRLLFHKNPLPMWTFDRQTLLFIDVNEAAMDLYGYSLEEFRQRSILDIRPAEDRSKVLENIAKNDGNNGNNSVWRHQKKDGSLLWVNITGFTFYEGERVITLVTAEDVTQKRAVEEALRASSERFHYVMNATNDIVWDLNLEEQEVLWSYHYQDIMGYLLPANNTLPFKHCVDCLHPDDRERVLDSLAYAIGQPGETLWENAFRYRRKDGTFAYVLEKAFILRNDAGKAYRLIGAMQDITEQQYQQKVQELELRIFALSARPETSMDAVLENIAGGLEQLHEHLRVAIVLFTDRQGEQLVGRHLTTGLQDWMSRFARQHKDKWLNSPLRKHLTTHSLGLADRNLLMAEWKGFGAKQLLSLPAIDNEGNLVASLLVFIGNDRGLLSVEWNALYRMQSLLRVFLLNHLAMAQIRMANERFDNVLQATHDLIWDWDIASGNYYRSPEALRRLYGSDPGKMASNVHDWISRIHTDDQPKVAAVIDSILAQTTTDTYDVEYRFQRLDGSVVHLQDRGIIIRDEAGKPLRMIGAAQDISERKRLEAELLQQELDRQRVISQATIDTQEQERAEIGRELHDNVNQVLTTTKLYLELAQSNADLRDELVGKANANIIHVINEIRQLSRSLMDPSIGDLGLVASIRDLVENINLTRKMRIRLNSDENLDNLLDESRKVTIFRIVQEAMSNIIRHSRATEVVVKLKKNSNAVLLQVSDNGVGFDPDGVKSGIGLKNIHNRVYLAKGQLQIIAAPGKGCTLKINFPLH